MTSAPAVCDSAWRDMMMVDAECLHAREEKREKAYIYPCASQHSVTMTKHLRQSTYKEKRLILVCSSGDFRA